MFPFITRVYPYIQSFLVPLNLALPTYVFFTYIHMCVYCWLDSSCEGRQASFFLSEIV